MLGVLRGDDPTSLRERPQPTFGDLSALVMEAEESGMRVQYDDRVLDVPQMPEQVGRTTYRIVQEGLTNARKHAPGVTVLVDVGGSPADGRHHPDPQPRPQPARDQRRRRHRAPGSAWSGSASGPSSPAAGWRPGARAARSS